MRTNTLSTLNMPFRPFLAIYCLTKSNSVETNIKSFYQNNSSSIFHIPENELTQSKTTLQNVCHMYNNIIVPYKYKHVIADLTNNKTISFKTGERRCSYYGQF